MVKSAPAQHAIITARGARLVAPGTRFALGQLTRSEHRYRLRGQGHEVMLRHRTRDAAILVEIGHARSYEPPAAASHVLRGALRIIDAGGYIGLFGLYALERWDVRTLVSFEPDPDNYRLLELNAVDERWQHVAAAVGTAAGTMRFRTGLFSESRTAEPAEPSIVVPVVDLFDYGTCDLLKIDIEGGEWPLLADDRLEGFARIIVLEWHWRGCPEREARQTACRMLANRGYVNQHQVSEETPENGLIWGWRDES